MYDVFFFFMTLFLSLFSVILIRLLIPLQPLSFRSRYTCRVRVLRETSCLGGRYIPVEVYPFSFTEYLDFLAIPHDDMALDATESRARFMKAYNDYLAWGGLPESISLPVRRPYLSSVFQKIYLGDIAQRNGVSNPRLLQLLSKKIAESIMQPISYNRMAKVLSTIAGKVSVPTVSNYVGYSEDAWLLLRVRNIVSAFAEKESVCKYYYIDNGLL